MVDPETQIPPTHAISAADERSAGRAVAGVRRTLSVRGPQVLHGASLQCRPVSSTIPAGIEGGKAEPLALPDSSRTNADDGLPRAPLGRVEGGDSFVEGR